MKGCLMKIFLHVLHRCLMEIFQLSRHDPKMIHEPAMRDTCTYQPLIDKSLHLELGNMPGSETQVAFHVCSVCCTI